MATDDNNLEQQKFTAICFTRFFPHVPYDNAQALQLPKLHTLQVRRLHCDSLWNPRCLGIKFCPSLIDNISLRVASCRIRNFSPVFCGAQKLPVHYRCSNCKLGMRLARGWAVRGSNYGGGEIFRTCPDRPWGPPSLLYNWYRVFPGGKVRPWSGVDHPPYLASRLKKE